MIFKHCASILQRWSSCVSWEITIGRESFFSTPIISPLRKLLSKKTSGSQCLKIPKKVSFYNFASEASYVYFLSGYIWIFAPKINIRSQKYNFDDFWRENSNISKINNRTKKCHFWRENSNETILMIFIHLWGFFC